MNSNNKKKITKFLAYIKQQHFDFYSTYNEYRKKISDLCIDIDNRDKDILEYKSERGIPLVLSSEMKHLWSFNDDVSYIELKEMKEKHEGMQSGELKRQNSKIQNNHPKNYSMR